MPTLSAPDGTALYYEVFEPARPTCAVFFLPGWSDHAGRWTHVGERLRDAGMAAYMLDARGQGRAAGRRGHLSRFSQLLGDLQAFRRLARLKAALPHVVFGHSFGGLVVLRYLETQPSDPIAAAIVASPWLGLAFQPPAWKLTVARALADLWPTLALPAGIDCDHLSRDPAVGPAYTADPLVHQVMTAGAWREIQWAQRVLPADAHRVEAPVLFLLAGEDRIVDSQLARAFADSLKTDVQVRWYAEMYHEVLLDPQRDQVWTDTVAFLIDRGLARQRLPT